MGIVKFARVVRFVFMGLGLIFGGVGALFYLYTKNPDIGFVKWFVEGFGVELNEESLGQVMMLFLYVGGGFLALSLLNFIIYACGARSLRRHYEQREEEREIRVKESADARRRARESADRERRNRLESYPAILEDDSLSDLEKARKVFLPQLKEAGQYGAANSNLNGQYIAGSNVKTRVICTGASVRLQDGRTLDGGIIVDLSFTYNGSSFRYDANETSQSEKLKSIKGDLGRVAENVKKHMNVFIKYDTDFFGYDVSYTVNVKAVDAGII